MDDGATLADQRYLTGFDAEDPFVSLYTPDETVLLVSTLEYERATEESRADTVVNWAQYYGSDDDVERPQLIADFLDEFGVESIAVNERFPLVTADGLREAGVEVDVDEDATLESIRATKTAEEVEWIQTVQRANEDAMRAAETRIAEADVVDGVLHQDGEALTAEAIKEEIEITLLRHGCGLDDTIVACGEQSAVPHDRGSGPLRANETIIVDIFPRSKATRYHADMTRTFCRGTPSAQAREFYDLTQDAKDAALDVLQAGVTGTDVDDAVCDVYENAGYPTLREDSTTDVGFFHSTGHGVGLEVHESPRLGQRADEPLRPGHVVTIEPGLYDPAVGGVRIEDIVVVTEDGHENLVEYPETFEL
jgi:Xaa-Pro aminopeptidase